MNLDVNLFTQLRPNVCSYSSVESIGKLSWLSPELNAAIKFMKWSSTAVKVIHMHLNRFKARSFVHWNESPSSKQGIVINIFSEKTIHPHRIKIKDTPADLPFTALSKLLFLNLFYKKKRKNPKFSKSISLQTIIIYHTSPLAATASNLTYE